MASSSWLPVLAGGVVGGVLTNLWAEWRQWRDYRRLDRHRFNTEQLQASTEFLALAFEAQRLQARRASLLLRGMGVDPAVSEKLDQRYRIIAEALAIAAARFRLLFPEPERRAMQTVVKELDALDHAVRQNSGAAAALTQLADGLELFSASCREYLVHIKN